MFNTYQSNKYLISIVKTHTLSNIDRSTTNACKYFDEKIMHISIYNTCTLLLTKNNTTSMLI